MLTELLSVCFEIIPMILGCAFLLRFWAHRSHAVVPFNVARCIVLMTEWLVMPLHKTVFMKRGGEWASLVAAVLIAWMASVLNTWLFGLVTVQTVIFLTLMSLVRWVCYGFMAMLFIEAVLSWVNPAAPFAFFIRSMTEPLLRPVRRVVPTLGQFDFSPMIVFFLLHLMLRLISQLLSFLV